jgi:hypothetical protein
VQEDQNLELENQSVAPASPRIDGRRQPRFKIETEITIESRTSGMLKGRSVDISESGIAAILPIEAPLGEIVELRFALPRGPVRIHATVRKRNAFRYGFEFVDQDLVNEFIRRTCRDLAVYDHGCWLMSLDAGCRIPSATKRVASEPERVRRDDSTPRHRSQHD